jgi:hypothetical protein
MNPLPSRNLAPRKIGAKPVLLSSRRNSRHDKRD